MSTRATLAATALTCAIISLSACTNSSTAGGASTSATPTDPLREPGVAVCEAMNDLYGELKTIEGGTGDTYDAYSAVFKTYVDTEAASTYRHTVEGRVGSAGTPEDDDLYDDLGRFTSVESAASAGRVSAGKDPAEGYLATNPNILTAAHDVLVTCGERGYLDKVPA